MVVVLVLLELDVTMGDGCEIWEHWPSFKEAKCLQGCSKTIWFSFLVLLKEMRTRGQFKISSCCFWWKSGELWGRGSPRFPCLTPVVESFSSDLLWTIISYWAESHLESCQTSTMELFQENSRWPQHVDYFRKKRPHRRFSQRLETVSYFRGTASSCMFDRILKATLPNNLLYSSKKVWGEAFHHWGYTRESRTLPVS